MSTSARQVAGAGDHAVADQPARQRGLGRAELTGQEHPDPGHDVSGALTAEQGWPPDAPLVWPDLSAAATAAETEAISACFCSTVPPRTIVTWTNGMDTPLLPGLRRPGAATCTRPPRCPAGP